MSSDKGVALVGLLETQRDLCVQLGEMARSQRRLVTMDDPSRLMAVLANRQRLTEELRVVSDRIGNTSERLDGLRGRMDATEVSRAESLRDEVRRRVRDILAADEEDGKLLMARKQMAKTAMSEVGRGQAALAAYQGSRLGAGVGMGREG